MKFRTIAITLALLGTAVPKAVAAQSIQELFAPDTLGAQVTYVESIIGPAWKIHDNHRVYKVGPCIVTLDVTRGEVAAIGMDVNDKCNVNLKRFVPNGTNEMAYPQTFGSVAATGGTFEYDADCLESCGNTRAPFLYMTSRGSHGSNYVDVTFGAVQMEATTIEAGMAWSDILIAKYGQDYLYDSKFNCDRRNDGDAAKILATAEVSRVTVGYDLDPTGCAGKTK